MVWCGCRHAALQVLPWCKPAAEPPELWSYSSASLHHSVSVGGKGNVCVSERDRENHWSESFPFLYIHCILSYNCLLSMLLKAYNLFLFIILDWLLQYILEKQRMSSKWKSLNEGRVWRIAKAPTTPSLMPTLLSISCVWARKRNRFFFLNKPYRAGCCRPQDHPPTYVCFTAVTKPGNSATDEASTVQSNSIAVSVMGIMNFRMPLNMFCLILLE